MFRAFSPPFFSGPSLRFPEDFGETPMVITELIKRDRVPLGQGIKRAAPAIQASKGMGSKGWLTGVPGPLDSDFLLSS